MQDEILTLRHVTKEYTLGRVNYGTLRKDLQSFWAKIRKKEDPNRKIGAGRYDEKGVFLALDDLSLSVARGETLGVIGRNGAGKSTLLKLLSRITMPTSGEIRFRGRMASMLEVGTGFHPELTGRENIYLNGAILGMKKGEIDRKVEKIIDFSECREFIDTPVKRYSSGMLVKLAFSVAAHLDGEILLMDEVLSVGDLAFREKSKEKMKRAAQEEGRTVLCVSHNMETIRDLCSRCIVLEEGKKIFDGNTDEAIGVYNELCDRLK
jgi:lipopolysaccharide transport system ATP-binding protein